MKSIFLVGWREIRYAGVILKRNSALLLHMMTENVRHKEIIFDLPQKLIYYLYYD